MSSNKLFLSLVLVSSSWVFMGYSQDPLAGLLSSLSNVAGGSDAAAAGLGAAGLPLGNAASSMTCGQKILPCKDFLKPPSSPTDACCAPLKQMIHGESKCLCNIFNNEELLKTFGVTQHEAVQLLVECGIKADIRQCNNTASAPAGSAHPPSPSPNTSTTQTGASDGDSAALLSALNGVLNSTNGTLNGTNATTIPEPASKNSAYSEKISLFGGFGFIAMFTLLFLSA